MGCHSAQLNHQGIRLLVPFKSPHLCVFCELVALVGAKRAENGLGTDRSRARLDAGN